MARCLDKESAISMFVNEFNMSNQMAEDTFNRFDTNANQILSVVEIKQFVGMLGSQ